MSTGNSQQMLTGGRFVEEHNLGVSEKSDREKHGKQTVSKRRQTGDESQDGSHKEN
jgi:hypothetical protein